MGLGSLSGISVIRGTSKTQLKLKFLQLPVGSHTLLKYASIEQQDYSKDLVGLK